MKEVMIERNENKDGGQEGFLKMWPLPLVLYVCGLWFGSFLQVKGAGDDKGESANDIGIFRKG